MSDFIYYDNSSITYSASAFKESYYAKNLDLTLWSDDQLESVIKDSAAEIEAYIGYPIFTNEVIAEQHQVVLNDDGHIVVRLYHRPIVSLEKVIIKYHPTVTQELHLTGWEIYNSEGILKYLFAAGEAYAEAVNGMLKETVFNDRYDLEVDYTAGVENIDRVLLKAIGTLAAGYINFEAGDSSSAGALKSIKSGNYQESYYESIDKSETSGGINGVKKRVYEMLNSYCSAPIV